MIVCVDTSDMINKKYNHLPKDPINFLLQSSTTPNSTKQNPSNPCKDSNHTAFPLTFNP